MSETGARGSGWGSRSAAAWRDNSAATSASSIEGAAPGGVASRSRSPRSVLVVEDDSTARRAITLILKRQGFVASEAGSVAEALRKLEARRPEWILLDLMLPDGYGTEILRTLRATE